MNISFRIAVSLLLSFIIINLYNNRLYLKTVLTNVKPPPIRLKNLITLQINTKTITPSPTPPDIQNQTSATYFQPSSAPQIKPPPIAPTVMEVTETPSPTLYSRLFPTEKPKPTKPPKPTATPKPPPITTDRRPGSTLEEIFQEVNKRACFPIALMKAFQYKESGDKFHLGDPPSKISIYNKYGWWIDGSGSPCTGLGYYAQSGLIPADSVNAGGSCSSPIGNPNDIKIMGLFQISEQEQEVAQKYITNTIPKNDRRVLFDNSLMFAYITKSRVPGTPPPDCNAWPNDTIRMVAEKHHGVCQYDYGNGVKGDYCKEILDLYNKYK
ncbi:hypothetical protein H3C65_03910 [Patescibacteria group bacterium]|nr:hypothetical protein [Patescibacteria group bacterium]